MKKKKRNRDQELQTATNMNPSFTVQNDSYQPLDQLIEQADNGIDPATNDITKSPDLDNEDM